MNVYSSAYPIRVLRVTPPYPRCVSVGQKYGLCKLRRRLGSFNRSLGLGVRHANSPERSRWLEIGVTLYRHHYRGASADGAAL